MWHNVFQTHTCASSVFRAYLSIWLAYILVSHMCTKCISCISEWNLFKEVLNQDEAYWFNNNLQLLTHSLDVITFLHLRKVILPTLPCQLGIECWGKGFNGREMEWEFCEVFFNNAIKGLLCSFNKLDMEGIMFFVFEGRAHVAPNSH